VTFETASSRSGGLLGAYGAAPAQPSANTGVRCAADSQHQRPV